MSQQQDNLKTHHEVLKLMGSRFEITAISEKEALAVQAVKAGIDEIRRIEKLISSWDPASQTSEVNRQAGIKPVAVDQELFDLINRAKKISTLTDGAFDISYASMDKIWKFDGSMKTLPDPDLVKNSVARIDFKNIMLDPEKGTVFLKEKGMKIGFGAIGKGYAANKAKSIMLSLGIQNGLVNAGGDLIAWGKKADGSDWQIGIANPKDKEGIFSWLTINEMAVVTSGDYERFVMFDGKRYAHIIDPRTGYPVSETKSVTIICPDAELADALATSVFVLGEKQGLNLINQLKGIECLIVNKDDEIKTSDNLDLNYYRKK
ncbi:FAD:protein FMN transferase [Fulvivirgaceae bacterium BMA10]|uniref:FAD:protein FMN transferase n=1 Tax=Splendidivirga corallicola TaxID=3051826 RepID=A0ABT8KUS2_9BACT|nr:FAD:protein FMN transferase [Fulvivirgaceae bacterium BMA10]